MPPKASRGSRIIGGSLGPACHTVESGPQPELSRHKRSQEINPTRSLLPVPPPDRKLESLTEGHWLCARCNGCKDNGGGRGGGTPRSRG